MNNIDRQNLSRLADSVNSSSPIGLNTATGAPNLGVPSTRLAATVADDATVGNSRLLEPKPGSKFAQPEDFGTVPVGMNSHGDYTGPGMAPRPSHSEQERTQREQVISPKPGSKFAQPEENDEFGAMPAPLSADQSDGPTMPLTFRIDPSAPVQADQRHQYERSVQLPSSPPEAPRPIASVPDNMSLPNSGNILMPKPGSKFAVTPPQR